RRRQARRAFRITAHVRSTSVAVKLNEDGSHSIVRAKADATGNGPFCVRYGFCVCKGCQELRKPIPARSSAAATRSRFSTSASVPCAARPWSLSWMRRWYNALLSVVTAPPWPMLTVLLAEKEKQPAAPKEPSGLPL